MGSGAGLTSSQAIESLSSSGLSSVLWKLAPAPFAVELSRESQPWRPAKHLEMLSEKLVDVVMGRCPRLIITMPPRHGKSELTSHWFPAWYLELFPHKRIILTSYEAEFAASWGGKVRETIQRNYPRLTVRFLKKNPPMHFLQTKEGGAMMTAGAGGAITGKGGDIIIVDDPIKNAEEASSLTMREKLWQWWTTTVRTRTEPGAGIVVIMTRWGSDDLVGRLLRQVQEDVDDEGDPWVEFRLPAFAKADDPMGRKVGEALWRERYDEKALKTIMFSVGPRVWSSMYQQEPVDEMEDGNVYYSYEDSASDGNLLPEDDLLNMENVLFWALDFNVDPMTSVIGDYAPWGERFSQRINVREELFLRDSNTEEMTRKALEIFRKYLKPVGQTYLEVYGDAAGTQRSTKSRKTDWQIVKAELEKEPKLLVRFLVKRANPPIKDRVNSVNACLKSAADTRRLFISQMCKNLRDDFKKCRWAVDSNGLPTGLIDKSTDIMRSHISDALGYMIEYRWGLRGHGGARRGNIR